MFDLSWSHIAILVVVALLVLGPKELPNAIRTGPLPNLGRPRPLPQIRRVPSMRSGGSRHVMLPRSSA